MPPKERRPPRRKLDPYSRAYLLDLGELGAHVTDVVLASGLSRTHVLAIWKDYRIEQQKPLIRQRTGDGPGQRARKDKPDLVRAEEVKRWCVVCGHYKDLAEFRKDGRSHRGYRRACVGCFSRQQKIAHLLKKLDAKLSPHKLPEPEEWMESCKPESSEEQTSGLETPFSSPMDESPTAAKERLQELCFVTPTESSGTSSRTTEP